MPRDTPVAPQSMPSKQPAPEPHWSKVTKAFWTHVLTEFRLEEHHRKILGLVCDALDRHEAAKWQLQFEGMTIQTPAGIRSHPCVKIVQESMTLALRGLRELGLDIPAPDAPRPPQLPDYKR